MLFTFFLPFFTPHMSIFAIYFLRAHNGKILSIALAFELLIL